MRDRQSNQQTETQRSTQIKSITYRLREAERGIDRHRDKLVITEINEHIDIDRSSEFRNNIQKDGRQHDTNL